MKEEWREVFDGYYEVSSLGNVRRAKPGTATFIGRPVQPVVSAGGYGQVHLHSADAKRRVYVHQIVAETFIGARPVGYVVNHIDGVKTNNTAINLEYVSSRENCMHALRTIGRRKGPTKPVTPLKGLSRGDDHWSRRMPERVARGERMGGSKLTESDVHAIRALRALGETIQSIADLFNVCGAQVYRIIVGQRWAWLT